MAWLALTGPHWPWPPPLVVSLVWCVVATLLSLTQYHTSHFTLHIVLTSCGSSRWIKQTSQTEVESPNTTHHQPASQPAVRGELLLQYCRRGN